ncbi:hypothetical protein FRX31_030700 [Thalictrum thalictroides]|uniref:Uncharacterized protein n=1 Tax=Thalictrum thalictroides TaxID=46969 RepID=A0A7J6V5N0_THATH|nr:hypothetical protein FRX31_030700 [Thalictrum thalictroides]
MFVNDDGVKGCLSDESDQLSLRLLRRVVDVLSVYRVPMSDMRARVKVMKHHYMLAREVLSRGGFIYNTDTTTIEAEAENWEMLIETNPALRAIRFKLLPWYMEWDAIWGVVEWVLIAYLLHPKLFKALLCQLMR